ncbi:sorting nexin mvp1 [Striga asiatica]|uniref:Sorting nexin mvp1 n=1 Tax=Striga asiatica TaxID=4170 RepID=A0A5A7PCM1_STRAF|nr:sorting nexin mvp1 [Striga asiatica]
MSNSGGSLSGIASFLSFEGHAARIATPGAAISGYKNLSLLVINTIAMGAIPYLDGTCLWLLSVRIIPIAPWLFNIYPRSYVNDSLRRGPTVPRRAHNCNPLLDCVEGTDSYRVGYKVRLPRGRPQGQGQHVDSVRYSIVEPLENGGPETTAASCAHAVHGYPRLGGPAKSGPIGEAVVGSTRDGPSGRGRGHVGAVTHVVTWGPHGNGSSFRRACAGVVSCTDEFSVFG